MEAFFKPIIQLPLDPSSCLSKQIAKRITDLYKALMPKEEIRLLPARTLAKLLHVCHGTINNAYAMLKRQGLTRTYGSRGSYLRPYREFNLQNVNNFNVVNEEALEYKRSLKLMPVKQEVAVLEITSRVNLNRVVAKMQMAFRSTIMKKLAWRSSEEWLCEAIQKKLEDEGLFVEPRNIFIPSGGAALMAVASVILKTGDLVVMDSDQDLVPGSIFRSLGCEIAFTGDRVGEGMNIEVLEEICQARAVRLVFIRADSSWPFGSVTNDSSRDQLISLSKQYDFRIIAFEYESDYATVKLPYRLSERQHDGRVIFVSVLSRASRRWEQTGYVVAEPHLIKILKDHDALLAPPRCHTFEQVTAVMYENGALSSIAKKLTYGHKNKLRKIAYILNYALSKKATVIKPSCGRFIVIQFHKPIHVKHLASLSAHQNLNYHERNKHLKEDQTISCLRIEYTVFEKAEWEVLANKLTEILS